MTLRAVSFTSVATALSLAGCFGELPDEAVGSAVAAVQIIPAGVGCLRVTFRAPGATADTTRSLTVTPGVPATFDLGYLAAGAYSFRANAFGVACASVQAATVPTWVGEAVPATVTPGIQTTVSITLRPNVMARTAVDFVQPVRAIYAGGESNTTYAVMQDGSVRAWGRNNVGQLGDGTVSDPAVQPRVVAGLSNPTQIAAASDFACATTNNGLWCWGANVDQLADGDLTEPRFLTPRGNPDLEPDAISAYDGHLCGRVAGTVRCWGTGFGFGFDVGGLNGPGVEATAFVAGSQASWLGQGLFTVNLSARLLRSRAAAPGVSAQLLRERVVAVSVGVSSYCAITGSGAVVCAGERSYVGAGSGSFVPFDAPVPNGVVGATALTSGLYHHCALTEGRSVACWGLNTSGQVGAGLDESVASTPLALPLRDVVQIAAGASHTCALVTDGSVWCWGLNTYGQLGDGTNTPRFTPVRVRF